MLAHSLMKRNVRWPQHSECGMAGAAECSHLLCSASQARTSRQARSFTVLWMATTLQSARRESACAAHDNGRTHVVHNPPRHVVFSRNPAFATHGVEEHLLRGVRPCVHCRNEVTHSVRLASVSRGTLTLPAPLLSAWWGGRLSPSGIEDRTRSVDSRRLRGAVRVHVSACAQRVCLVWAHLWPGAGLLLSVAALGLCGPVSPQPATGGQSTHFGAKGTDNAPDGVRAPSMPRATHARFSACPYRLAARRNVPRG
jgi:hypothetical protein